MIPSCGAGNTAGCWQAHMLQCPVPLYRLSEQCTGVRKKSLQPSSQGITALLSPAKSCTKSAAGSSKSNHLENVSMEHRIAMLKLCQGSESQAVGSVTFTLMPTHGSGNPASSRKTYEQA